MFKIFQSSGCSIYDMPSYYSRYKHNSNARRSYPSRLVVLVKDKSIDEHIASTTLHCPVLRLAVTTLESGTGISWTFSEIWGL